MAVFPSILERQRQVTSLAESKQREVRQMYAHGTHTAHDFGEKNDG